MSSVADVYRNFAKRSLEHFVASVAFHVVGGLKRQRARSQARSLNKRTFIVLMSLFLSQHDVTRQKLHHSG